MFSLVIKQLYSAESDPEYSNFKTDTYHFCNSFIGPISYATGTNSQVPNSLFCKGGSRRRRSDGRARHRPELPIDSTGPRYTSYRHA